MPPLPSSIDHSDEFGISIKIGTFNLRNCALPNFTFYANQEPYDSALYTQKRDWIAQQLDEMNADMVVFQEVFQVQAMLEFHYNYGPHRDTNSTYIVSRP